MATRLLRYDKLFLWLRLWWFVYVFVVVAVAVAGVLSNMDRTL